MNNLALFVILVFAPAPEKIDPEFTTISCTESLALGEALVLLPVAALDELPRLLHGREFGRLKIITLRGQDCVRIWALGASIEQRERIQSILRSHYPNRGE